MERLKGMEVCRKKSQTYLFFVFSSFKKLKLSELEKKKKDQLKIFPSFTQEGLKFFRIVILIKFILTLGRKMFGTSESNSSPQLYLRRDSQRNKPKPKLFISNTHYSTSSTYV